MEKIENSFRINYKKKILFWNHDLIFNSHLDLIWDIFIN